MSRNEILAACANCGNTPNDDSVKLKACTACRLVKYCNQSCQIAHCPQHKKGCKKHAAELLKIETQKEKEAAFNAELMEILDLSEDVRSPPERPDCPICMEKIPPRSITTKYLPCGGQVICHAYYCRSTSNMFSNETLEDCSKPMIVLFAEALMLFL